MSFLSAAMLVGLAGCTASILSRAQAPAAAVGDGVVYYMPEQPIKVTLTFAAKSKKIPHPPGVPSVQSLDPAPDLTQRFLLTYDKNLFGKNHLNVSVTTAGLLTTANTDTTSDVVTIVQNLGKDIGDIQALAMSFVEPQAAPKNANPCPAGQTYTLLIRPDDFMGDVDSRSLCGYRIEMATLDGTKPIKYKSTAHLSDTTAKPGVFYKQELPYLVTVTDPAGDPPSIFVVYSPDLSPTGFLPVTTTFFSDNQTKITLSNGTLTSVDESADGEVSAAVGLPAAFIDAYATAVGSLFKQLGTNVQDQTSLIDNERALAVAGAQQSACRAVMLSSKPTLDPANLRGKVGVDLTTAVNNISAAVTAIKGACTPQ
jgi:hypothetical protein